MKKTAGGKAEESQEKALDIETQREREREREETGRHSTDMVVSLSPPH